MSSRGAALEIAISWILRVGVGLSLVLESLGILLGYLQTGESSLTIPSGTWLAKGGNFFGFASSSIGSILSGVTPSGVTALGVAVLMLTPYARMVAALVYYAVEQDLKYVSITLFVLSVITAGLVLL